MTNPFTKEQLYHDLLGMYIAGDYNESIVPPRYQHFLLIPGGKYANNTKASFVDGIYEGSSDGYVIKANIDYDALATANKPALHVLAINNNHAIYIYKLIGIDF